MVLQAEHLSGLGRNDRSKKSWKRKIGGDKETMKSKEELLQHMKMSRKVCWRDIHTEGGV